jgi:O-antigen/teichoic acid export membrane protein
MLKNDFLFKSLLRNSSILASGTLIASGLGLITTILSARTLGPEEFGILVSLTTYVIVIDGLTNFQSWQALIKFGSESIEVKDSKALQKVVVSCLKLDIFTAILGASISYFFASYAGTWLGWNSTESQYAAVYGFIILTHITGTPQGILHLFGEFKYTSLKNVIS